MYRFDESGWPVVEIEASGTTTVADVEEYFARWESWLSRREPLGVVLRYRGEEQGKPDKEARRLSNRWHKENRELTGRYCAGVAAVVESSKLVAVYKPIASTVMRKMMGCPGGVFSTYEEAVRWISERLAYKSAEVAAHGVKGESTGL